MVDVVAETVVLVVVAEVAVVDVVAEAVVVDTPAKVAVDVAVLMMMKCFLHCRMR